MLGKNFKKAFTLAELMVVLAIIGILSAAAMNIFTGAIAEARDSNRVTDLNTMKSAIEQYYIKHKVYPQPAKQTEENVWGYIEGEDAIATCGVSLDANGEIDSDIGNNKCGGNIVIKEKKVDEIKCGYNFTLNGSNTAGDFTISSTVYFLDKDGNNINLVLSDIYEFDNLNDVCLNYVSNSMKNCLDSDDGSAAYDCSSNISDEISDIKDYYNFYKALSSIESTVSVSSKKYSISDTRDNLIGWKGTLTEKSGVNSIYESDEEKIKKSFYGFMEENGIDPKYKSSKYKDYGFGFYPYSVFRDGAGDNISKTFIGGTSYQISATLEKQDADGNYHPETLIIGNYKRPKNPDTGKIKAGYPRSLFGNGTDVIVNEQKEGEKAKYVARPNGTTNRGIPYGVEEIE